MNYLKHYIRLVRKAEGRTLSGYKEGHHVFAKSIYGPNDRIVYLTAREHYVAHALLERVYRKRYGDRHNHTIKMAWAFCRMNFGGPYQEVHHNSRLYQEARKRLSIVNSEVFSGEGNPFYGQTHDEEWKKEFAEKRKGKGNPNYGKKRDKKWKKEQAERLSKTWKLTKDTGEEIIVTNLQEFCKENKYSQGNLSGVMKGKVKKCYGFVKVEVVNG